MDPEKEKMIRDYAWGYFAFHADQRMKTFNFFLLAAGLLAGGITTLLKDGRSLLWVAPLGFVLSALAFIFWRLDKRNRQLVRNGEAALKYLDSQHDYKDQDGVPHVLKIFDRDDFYTQDPSMPLPATARTPGKKNSKMLDKLFSSYSKCLRCVFWIFILVGLFFGIGSIWIGITSVAHAPPLEVTNVISQAITTSEVTGMGEKTNLPAVRLDDEARAVLRRTTEGKWFEKETIVTYAMPFATAGLGALLGALSAFWLGIVKQKRDESNRRHTALLTTQYALFSQWNIVEDIRKSLLEPHRDDPLRHQKLRVFISPQAVQRVPFKELSFIIESDEPNLLQEIHRAEQGFLSVVELLDRNNKLREAFLKEHKPLSFDLETGIGEVTAPNHVIYGIKNATDVLYVQVDRVLPIIDAQIKNIFAFVKRNFKGKKAMSTVTAIK